MPIDAYSEPDKSKKCFVKRQEFVVINEPEKKKANTVGVRKKNVTGQQKMKRRRCKHGIRKLILEINELILGDSRIKYDLRRAEILIAGFNIGISRDCAADILFISNQ